MLHEDEREIIDFLHRVGESERYERRVQFMPWFTGHGRKGGLLDPLSTGSGNGATIEQIWVDPSDVASLHERGYLDGPHPRSAHSPYLYTLSQEGRQLRDRGYVELPDPLTDSQTQYNLIYGQATIAQTGTGAISQHVGESADIATIRVLLAELREALVHSEMAEEDREEYQSAVDRLDGELVAQSPRLAVLLRVWAIIQTIGAAESFLQAGERASALVHALTPHMHALFPK